MCLLKEKEDDHPTGSLKEKLYGTQINFVNNKRWPYPILQPKNVDQRRAKIGLGPLKPYLKKRFDIDWN